MRRAKYMKKKLARAAAIVGMMTMVALSAVGCGKKVECDFCGEVKKCKTETIFGEEIHYCSDCEAEINSWFQ